MSKVQLQTPQYALRNGELIPWQDALLHVGCEAVNRGLSVFEGIKGYWQADGSFGLLAMREHYDRLCQSASLLHIPCPWSYEDFEAQVATLVNALLQPGKDLWVRATLFVVEGHWGLDTRADLILTAFQCDRGEQAAMKLGISTWQRSSDNSVSYRIKSAANYQVGRLARIEGRAQGCDDMILLNALGRVAEASGSAVLMIRNGAAVTPCTAEGALESITIDICESIAHSLQIPFQRRPLDRTELLVADEICLCGPLTELVPASQIDGRPIDPAGPVLNAMRERYFAVVRGEIQDGSATITPLPGVAAG